MSDLNKILHVEDEPDIQEVARMALETFGGYTVETCSSGEEAMEKGPGFNPDLILMDVMMPGMDGPTTLQAMRETAEMKDTPVIFMTAKVMETELERFRELGAADVIPKPFDPVTLADQVKEIWDRVTS
ncbi:MAG: response regulator [Rhodospirillaceae bacterium]|jgi:CheY-like chemotaxis protein|nr:response regulator [Rhodospirillaceae bacterium]MBT4220019.1 response regulator [Rhodospirillaceae bacterium]MBT4463594.1 response regulator [Rhodospirillaceae bacterium]MBT5309854.1 response regulator [Rhodospirillaceae bacterium]MBT6406706.1 response regulator [Rhodospirillaceae bacterium]